MQVDRFIDEGAIPLSVALQGPPPDVPWEGVIAQASAHPRVAERGPALLPGLDVRREDVVRAEPVPHGERPRRAAHGLLRPVSDERVVQVEEHGADGHGHPRTARYALVTYGTSIVSSARSPSSSNSRSISWWIARRWSSDAVMR